MIAHLTTQRNAIAMLNSRIQFLQQYLQDTKSGIVPVDHDIIRQISSLCRRSPVLEKKAFDEQFSTVSRKRYYIKHHLFLMHFMFVGVQRCIISGLPCIYHKRIKYCE